MRASLGMADTLSDTHIQKIQLIMKLRSNGIVDTDVLSAIEQVDREVFIPDNFRAQAYEDCALPIAMGQTISQPSVVAHMSSLIEPNDRMRVLEIGTGSGYQAAILSKLFRMVFSIEVRSDLLEGADAIFKKLNINNINTKCANGRLGWSSAAPFDRIIITAAGKSVPQTLIDQLNIGGIIVAPVGDSASGQKIVKIRKLEDSLETEEIASTKFVPLI